MTALSANITDSQTLVPVDAGLTNGSFQLPLYYTVDSEAIRVTGRAHRTTWLVERGIAGTTAASHSSAATLTRYYPEAATGGAGAGGVTVTGTEGGEVAPVTSLNVATVNDEGSGVVSITPAIYSDTEPTPPLAHGTLWIRQDADETAAVLQLRVWNADIEGFEDVGLGDRLLGSQVEWTGFSANGTEGNATLQFGGNPEGAINFHLKDEDGANDRHYRLLMGGARVELSYIEPDAVSTDNIINLGPTGIAFTGSIGFGGMAPIVPPVVPQTTPDVQDVIDALVALGLVTQSD